MKYHWFEHRLRAGLALLLAVGLCACGSGGERENGSGMPGTSEADGGGGNTAGDSGSREEGQDTKTANLPGSAYAALAKENVYQVREVEIPGLEDSEAYSVESTSCWNGRIDAILKKIDWENGPDYYRLSLDEDGKVLQKVLLELPEKAQGQGEENPEQEQGQDEENPEQAQGQDEENPGQTGGGGAAEADPNVWEQEDVRYSDFVTGADGRVYGLRQYQYVSIDYRTDRSRDERHLSVCCWDESGSLLWQTEPCGNGEGLSVDAILPGAEGSLELLLTGEGAYRLSIGADGVMAEAGKEKLSEAAGKALENCRRLLRKADGTCLLLCRNAEGSLSLMNYDPRTDATGEACPLPEDFPASLISSIAFAAGTDADLIYASRDGVFSYTMGEEGLRLKMDYVNSDRNITDTFSLQALDDTHFCLFYREDYGRELKAGIFEYMRPEEIPDKEVVLLGGLTVNGGIKKRVIRYNRENGRYRVVVKEYPSAGELNLEIVAGRMPDILLADGLPSGERPPMESYMAKGLLADVRLLIEGDPELSGTDFLENVFDAYSPDGKLMYVVPSFTVTTMAARSSHVEEGSDWSLEKMLEVLEGMGSQAQLLDGLTRDTFLEKVLEYRGSDFADRRTGKCTFDSQAFLQVLKFAAALPEEASYAGESAEDGYEQQYLRDRTLLMELSIWSFSREVDERLFYELNGYLGGDYTFAGFPGEEAEAAGSGGGALIHGVNRMALSARSGNPEGAWDFARYYLTEDFQKGLESSLPVNRRLFEEWAQEETVRPYYLDDNGEKVEYDHYISRNGESTVVSPLSREQLDRVIAYVESATATPFEDQQLLNIIREEAEAYFSGQKTAEDVAAVIQRRAQMYVQENQ